MSGNLYVETIQTELGRWLEDGARADRVRLRECAEAIWDGLGALAGRRVAELQAEMLRAGAEALEAEAAQPEGDECGCPECVSRRATKEIGKKLPDDAIFTLGNQSTRAPVAVMNEAGVWTVDWEEVAKVAALPADPNLMQGMLVILMCRLLQYARPALPERPAAGVKVS